MSKRITRTIALIVLVGMGASAAIAARAIAALLRRNWKRPLKIRPLTMKVPWRASPGYRPRKRPIGGSTLCAMRRC